MYRCCALIQSLVHHEFFDCYPEPRFRFGRDAAKLSLRAAPGPITRSPSRILRLRLAVTIQPIGMILVSPPWISLKMLRNSTNPRPGEGPTPDKVVQKVFEVKCEQGMQGARSVVDFAAPADHKIEAQVRGEFCPTSTNPLTVLFVVDFSASMGKHYPLNSDTLSTGHDPQLAGQPADCFVPLLRCL